MSTGTPSLRERTGGLTSVPAVWWAIGAILLDRAITLPLWAYEANPLVAGMGQLQWVGVTALLIGGLLVAWYPGNARQSRAGHGLVWGIAGLHVTVVVLNVGVVTGVL